MGKLYNIFKIFIKNFLTNSTVHGLGHLAAKRRQHFLETFSWFLLFASCVYAVSVLSSMALRRYTENPTVISMERDRFSWNTSFPTATVCPINRLNEKRLSDFVERVNVSDKKALQDFLVKLSQASYDTFAGLPFYENLAPENYMKILLELAFDFKPTVTNSGMNNVKRELETTITEMGICYSFNSQLAVYNSPEYRNNGSWKLLEEQEIFYVNPLDGDVFVSLMNMSNGVRVKTKLIFILDSSVSL